MTDAHADRYEDDDDVVDWEEPAKGHRTRLLQAAGVVAAGIVLILASDVLDNVVQAVFLATATVTADGALAGSGSVETSRNLTLVSVVMRGVGSLSIAIGLVTAVVVGLRWAHAADEQEVGAADESAG